MFTFSVTTGPAPAQEIQVLQGDRVPRVPVCSAPEKGFGWLRFPAFKRRERPRTAAILTACFVFWFTFCFHPGAALAAAGDRRYAALDSLASWLAGRPVGVVCRDRDRDANLVSAYTPGAFDRRGRWHPGSEIVMERTYCEALLDLIRHDTRRWYVDTLAQAILLLAHETGHLRGWLDESLAQRWGLRNVARVAEHLGYSHDAALLLLADAVEWQRDHAPKNYRAGCSHPYLDADGNLKGCSRT